MSPFCPSCGTPTGGLAFCGKCGASLGGAAPQRIHVTAHKPGWVYLCKYLGGFVFLSGCGGGTAACGFGQPHFGLGACVLGAIGAAVYLVGRSGD